MRYVIQRITKAGSSTEETKDMHPATARAMCRRIAREASTRAVQLRRWADGTIVGTWLVPYSDDPPTGPPEDAPATDKGPA